MRRVLAGLCEGDAPWAGVSEAGPAPSLVAVARGWAGTGRTTRSLPLGRLPSAHIRPTARLAAAAREPLGPWHSKVACASPGASRLGHVGGLSGHHDARGRSGWWVRAGGAAAVAAMQGPLAGSAAAAGGPGGRTATRTAAAARRAQPAVAGRPGPTTSGDHEEHGVVISTFFRIGEWATTPCTRPSRAETLRKPMYGAPIAVVVCCGND